MAEKGDQGALAITEITDHTSKSARGGRNFPLQAASRGREKLV